MTDGPWNPIPGWASDEQTMKTQTCTTFTHPDTAEKGAGVGAAAALAPVTSPL